MNKDLVTNTITYSDWSGAQEFIQLSVLRLLAIMCGPNDYAFRYLQNGVPTMIN